MTLAERREVVSVLTIKIDVDQETYEQLVDQAVGERRSIPQHAGVVIRRAFGLPFPEPATSLPSDLVAVGESTDGPQAGSPGRETE